MDNTQWGAGPGLHFSLLGPLHATDGARDLTPTRASVRAVLALLLLRANRSIAASSLVDDLWGASLPANPMAALKVSMSRLRSSLGDAGGRLVARGGAYELVVERGELDLERASTLLDDARRDVTDGECRRALDRLDEARSLWRGDPLLDLANRPFFPTAHARVRELRLQIVVARHDVLLVMGHNDEVLRDVADVIADEPWRETLRAQQLLALYRAGRQVDALQTYERYRRALRDDMGLEPGPALAALHRRMLQHDPSLVASPAARAHTSGPVRDEAHPPDERTVWFRSAVEAVDWITDPADEVRARVLIALAEAQHDLGDSTWRNTVGDAVAVASRSQDVQALAHAAMVGARGWSETPNGGDGPRTALVELALGKDPDDATRARLLAVLASERTFTHPLEHRLELSDRAVEHARQSGDRGVLLFVLLQRFNAIWTSSTLATRVADSAEALDIADWLGAPLPRALAAGWRMAACVESGRLAEADACREIALALGRELDSPLLLWSGPLHGSWRAVIDGDLEAAERLCESAHAYARHGNRPEADAVHFAQLLAVRWAQERLGEMVDVIDAVLTETAGLPGLRAWQARARLAAGDGQGATALLREQGRVGFDTIPADQLQLSAFMVWSEVAARTKSGSEAAALYQCLRPSADQFVHNGVGVYGPVASGLFELARILGDAEHAERWQAAAETMARAMPSPFFLARTQRERAPT